MPSLLQPTKPLRCTTDHVICCCSHLQGCQVCIHKCGWRGSQMGRQGSWDAGVLSTGCKAKRRQADVNARIVGRRSSFHRLQGKRRQTGPCPQQFARIRHQEEVGDSEARQIIHTLRSEPVPARWLSHQSLDHVHRLQIASFNRPSAFINRESHPSTVQAPVSQLELDYADWATARRDGYRVLGVDMCMLIGPIYHICPWSGR
jgi:hypothetical protein